MKRMSKTEVKQKAKQITNSWLAGYSLHNAKQISLEVRRLLLAEQSRRKKI